MANTFITPQIVAREALLQLENTMVSSSLAYRDFTSEFTAEKVGDTVTIRKPAVFEAKEFTGTIDVQNGTEGSTSIQLEKHFDVSFELTAKDRTLQLEELSEQLIQPAILALAEGLNSYYLSKYVEIPYFVENTGFPDTLAEVIKARTRLNKLKVPTAGRVGIVDPDGEATLLGIEAFLTADKIGDEGTALREASIGRKLGFNWFMDQQVPTHTAGTFAAGSPVVNGAVAAGATTLAIDGGSGGETLKKGDLFTVANVEGQFVVTADATASGAGAIAAASFYPAAPAGGFADNAAITIKASHVANLVLHPFAMGMAIVAPPAPLGAQSEIIANRGIAIRVVYDYNSTNKKDVISLDFLAGCRVVQPELAARVPG